MPKRLVRAATVVALLVALTACESSGSSNGKKSQSQTPTQIASTAASPQTRGTTSPSASSAPSTAPSSSESKAATSAPASVEASERPTSTPAPPPSRDHQSPSEPQSSPQSTGAFTTSVECTPVPGAESPVSKVVFRGNGTKYSARFVYEDGVGTPPDTLGYVVTLFGEDGANGVLSAGHLNGKKVFPVEDDNFVVIEHGYLTIVEAYTRIPGITRPFSWYAEVKDTDNTIATCGTKTTAVSVD
jgi:mandelate racemase / muconate lactonizing enzyme